MKKFLLIGAALLAVLTVSGCSDKNTDLIGVDSESKENQDIAEQAYTQDYMLLDGRPFSNGLAWIKGEEENGAQFIAAIKPTGEIAFKVDDATAIDDSLDSAVFNSLDGAMAHRARISDFNSVSAIVETSSSNINIVDKEGNILNSIEGENVIVQAVGDYYLVKKGPEGYTKQNPQIGVLDKNGQWVAELHEMSDE